MNDSENVLDSQTHIAAMILAAGRSLRFGAGNKLHARVDRAASTILECVMQTVASSIPGRKVVVLGANENESDTLARVHGLEVVINPYPENGIGSSIATGAQALKSVALSGIAIFPGDIPLIRSATIGHVVTEFLRHDGRKIIRPEFCGQPGHPVIFPASFVAVLGSLTGDRGAARIVNENSDRTIAFRTEDQGIVLDIDRPEDLAKARELAIADSKMKT